MIFRCHTIFRYIVEPLDIIEFTIQSSFLCQPRGINTSFDKIKIFGQFLNIVNALAASIFWQYDIITLSQFHHINSLIRI